MIMSCLRQRKMTALESGEHALGSHWVEASEGENIWLNGQVAHQLHPILHFPHELISHIKIPVKVKARGLVMQVGAGLAFVK